MSRPELHLLQPTSLRGLELKNRMALAPMTRGRAVGGERLANATMAEYYVQRSTAGLVITEGTGISPQGNGWVDAPGIYTEAQAGSWRQVTEAVHAAGAPIFLQLWHTGRASHSSFLDGELPVAPSAIAQEGDGVHTRDGKQPHEVPRALRTEELPGVVEQYAHAARLAKSAGFDGVEVHSANGYLLDEFLQSKTNQRTDAYGGTVENRFRLLREVVEAVTQVFPADRVGVRLSPNGVFNDMGSDDFRETFLHAATGLSPFGLAYLHVMDGLGFGFHEKGEPMTLDEFRAVFDGPLMGNCGYDLDAAEAAVRDGKADLIAFGRPYIANPDLPERFAAGVELAESNMETWYAGELGAEGYTDYPPHGS